MLVNNFFNLPLPIYLNINIADIIITKLSILYPHNFIVISFKPAPIILVDKVSFNVVNSFSTISKVFKNTIPAIPITINKAFVFNLFTNGHFI